MSTRIVEIPKEISDKLKPCWKCGSKPIVQYISESIPGMSLFYEIRIGCSNKKCSTSYYFADYKENIDEHDIQCWNDMNVEKYIPKGQLKETEQNCSHCKHKKECIHTREERIAQFFDSHVCDDFEIV